MINFVRRSQLIDLNTIDYETSTLYGPIDEVWVNPSGQVSYVTTNHQACIPIEQVKTVQFDRVHTYTHSIMTQPDDLYPLYQLAVHASPTNVPRGWIEDFLFDCETGDIAAYILEGDIAKPFGGRAVLYPNDVLQISAGAIVLREGAENRLKSEPEGLKGFLNKTSQQVQGLVKRMGTRLQPLVTPNEKPEVVRVKINQVKDQVTTSGRYDQTALREATEFVQDKWHDIQQSLSRASQHLKTAVNNTWNHWIQKG